MTAEPNNDIDVGAILEQLRNQIREQRLTIGKNEQSALERELGQSLDDIELYRFVSAHWPLKSQSLPGKFVVMINKVVRRLLRWYINPIVEQQNAYNDAIARALRLLAECYNELSSQMSDGSSQKDRGEPASGEPQASVAHPEPGSQEDAKTTGTRLYTAPQQSTQHIQSLVSQRAQHEPAAQFNELKLAALSQQLKLHQHVLAHWPLQEGTALERVVALIHKLTRQYLRWLINPIVEQQNHANAAISRVILLLVQVDEQRRVELARKRADRHKTRDT